MVVDVPLRHGGGACCIGCQHCCLKVTDVEAWSWLVPRLPLRMLLFACLPACLSFAYALQTGQRWGFYKSTQAIKAQGRVDSLQDR